MALTSVRLGGNKRLTAASENNPVIAKGESDRQAVEILQTGLVELGFAMPRSTKPNGLLDGIFGAETDAAVRKFQTASGLKADGIVGRLTLTRLDIVFDGLVKAEGPTIAASIANPNGGWGIS